MCIASVAAIGCKGPRTNVLPPAPMLAMPGPGVGGPGPGVLAPAFVPPAGVMATSQIAFMGPEGMSIQWDIAVPGAFDSQPLVAPGRYNFPQGAIYRLKLTNIPGRPGVELYPTIEVAPALPRSDAFLAHNAVPVQFTEEDFDQVLSGNFVTKVIYLPDPAFQQLALAGVETLVSTRLDPGVDPIVEADRRGAILAIVRLGNKDLQVAGGSVEGGGVMPTAFNGPYPLPCPPGAAGMGGMAGAVPPGYVAGVTAPEYGMPMVGTPIGLAGPPHVPLGIPAGLQKHVMVNHTKVHLPPPTEGERVDVKQVPGYSYPEPVSHVKVVESGHAGLGSYHGYHSVENDIPALCQRCGHQHPVDCPCPAPCPAPCPTPAAQ